MSMIPVSEKLSLFQFQRCRCVVSWLYNGLTCPVLSVLRRNSSANSLWAAAKLIIVSPVAEVAFHSFVGSLLAHLKMPLLLRLKPAEMSMRYASEL